MCGLWLSYGNNRSVILLRLQVLAHGNETTFRILVSFVCECLWKDFCPATNKGFLALLCKCHHTDLGWCLHGSRRTE